MTVINIDSNNFEKYVENSTGPAIVDFFATWCGPCKRVSPILDKMSDQHDGKVQFFKVDIDQNPDLTAKFGIISVPTLIGFKDGKQVETMVGGGNAAAIENKFSELF
ncbi:MAG: thioredoxin [Micrococcaceae bacterium]